MILGQQKPRQIGLAAADMRMHVDAARHDDHAGGVVFAIGRNVRGHVDDTAVAKREVAALAVDVVGRVEDRAAVEPDQRHGRTCGGGADGVAGWAAG